MLAVKPDFHTHGIRIREVRKWETGDAWWFHLIRILLEIQIPDRGMKNGDWVLRPTDFHTHGNLRSWTRKW
jgi:hypothetical protein